MAGSKPAPATACSSEARAARSGVGDLRRAGGEREALRRAHEELVAEGVSQPREGVARGRLRESDALRCARDVALGEERVEHPEEVQVDGFEIHGVHDEYINHALYR